MMATTPTASTALEGDCATISITGYISTETNSKEGTLFAETLEWRVCRHRTTRRRPLPLQGTAMPEGEYCDLSADEEKGINQWCRMKNCPYLDRPDVQ